MEDKKDLFKAIQISEKIIGDILEINTVEAFTAFIGATIDTWCLVHKYHSADIAETVAIANKTVNEKFGEMEELK